MQKALPLYIKCKTCGVEYWSAIKCKKEQFYRLYIGGNRQPCPNGHNDRYQKEDYYFKE
jgi:hypothetical protein